MRNILLMIVIVFTLSACAAGKTLVVENTRTVVMPPEGLWNCPKVPAPPSGEYTQAEVADYVLKIYEAHQVCKSAIDDVKRYLEQAQLITEK